jgi:general secretion pathway protein I
MAICRSKQTKQQGLTLVEVLIALAILSIALTALLVTMTRDMRDAQTITEKTAALWCAQNQITALQNNPKAELGYAATGARTQYGIALEFKARVSATPDKNVNQIIVTIDEAKTHRALYTLTGYKPNA